MSIKVSAIAAMAQNGVIGINNKMPWHIPGDMKRFKERTMGKPVIVGRKTFESVLGYLGKPFPGRTSIVVSRSGYEYEDVPVFSDIETAIEHGKNIAKEQNLDEIIIGGGAEIYKLAMPYTTHFHLTVIEKDYDGDAFLDCYKASEWQEIKSEAFPDNDPPYSIKTLKRI